MINISRKATLLDTSFSQASAQHPPFCRQLSIDKQSFLCYSPAVKNQYVNNNLREENLAREHTLKGTLLVAGI